MIIAQAKKVAEKRERPSSAASRAAQRSSEATARVGATSDAGVATIETSPDGDEGASSDTGPGDGRLDTSTAKPERGPAAPVDPDAGTPTPPNKPVSLRSPSGGQRPQPRRGRKR